DAPKPAPPVASHSYSAPEILGLAPPHPWPLRDAFRQAGDGGPNGTIFVAYCPGRDCGRTIDNRPRHSKPPRPRADAPSRPFKGSRPLLERWSRWAPSDLALRIARDRE